MNEREISAPFFLLLTDLLIWWLLGDIVTNLAETFLNVICFGAAFGLLVVIVIELFDLLADRNTGSAD